MPGQAIVQMRDRSDAELAQRVTGPRAMDEILHQLLKTVVNIPLFVAGWWFGCHFLDFPRNIGFLIIPIDELIFFRGVAQPPTSHCL